MFYDFMNKHAASAVPDKDMNMEYELHELCAMFPLMKGKEFEDLCNDISLNGLRNPIVLYQGKILDGQNRYAACIKTNVQPRFTEYDRVDVASYVLSQNLNRRHMEPGQRAAAVATVQDWRDAHPIGALAKEAYESKSKEIGNVTGLSTVADRAALSGVSDKTQRNADKIAKADPELAAKVTKGEISLPKALEIVKEKEPKKKKAKDDREALEKLCGIDVVERAEEPPEGPEPEMIEIDKYQYEETMRIYQELMDENESYQIASLQGEEALVKENKDLKEQIRMLREQVTGLINARNEAIRTAKTYKARFEKLERETKRAAA